MQDNLIVKIKDVTGTPAAAFVYTDVIDLGPSIQAGVAWVALTTATSSAGASVSIQFSHDGVNFSTNADNTLAAQAFKTGSLNIYAGGRIMGRFVRGMFANGTTQRDAYLGIPAILTFCVQRDSP